MIFKGRWFAHMDDERVMCVCKEENEYWTIILAPKKRDIFIITAYPSNTSERHQFEKGIQLNTFEPVDDVG